MSRTKSYARETVLKKAIPVFMRKGYADTSIQDLEQATGINKSSLYSEFDSKEGLYTACINHFAEFKSAKNTLVSEPYGWSNIETFLSYVSEYATRSENGCLLVYSMREHNSLSETLKAQNEAHLDDLRQLAYTKYQRRKNQNKFANNRRCGDATFRRRALLQNVGGLEKSPRPAIRSTSHVHAS